jgi:NMD protein affecting ribosome stability and mRNA decay
MKCTECGVDDQDLVELQEGLCPNCTVKLNRPTGISDYEYWSLINTPPEKAN